MRSDVALIDMSAIAGEVGLRLSRGQLHHWADLPQPERDQAAPVYLTRRLCEALGGPGQGAAFQAGARQLLQAAHAVVHRCMVEGTMWRAGGEVAREGGPLRFIIIVGHNRSDGLAIGLGPGDFW